MSQAKRRQLLVAAGVLLAAPFAHAQSQRTRPERKVGFLLLEPEPAIPGPQRAGSLELRKRGWIEGENLVVERAHANFDVTRFARLADELIRKRVDVIIAGGPEAALAAARATRSIPIVFFNVVWPIEQGLINSFARPGRNLTGISFYTGVEVTNKRLEFLREIVPEAKRLSWLWPPDYAVTVAGGSFDMAPVMEAAAKGLGFETRFHPIRKVDDVETVLKEVMAWRAQAVTASGSHVSQARARIAEFALQNQLPTAFPSRFNVEAGGLLAYAPAQAEFEDLNRRFYDLVERILLGAAPGDLPVERPSRYELVINLKTARALGLKVPQSILVRADRVIE